MRIKGFIFLKKLIKKDKRFKLILNKKNLGTEEVETRVLKMQKENIFVLLMPMTSGIKIN